MAVLNKANNTTALNAAGAWVENQAPNNTNAGVIGASITGFTTGSSGGIVTFANFLLESTYPAAGNTYAISGTTSFTLTGPYTPNGVTQPYSLYVAPGKRLTYEGPIQINTRAAGSEPISEHILFVGAGGSFEVNPSGSGDGRIRIINASVTAIRKQGTGYVSSGRSATAETWTAGSLYIDEGEFWISGFAGTNPIGTNTLYFTPIGAATPTLRFLQGGGPSATRTLANAVSVTTRGTITVDSGFTATMTGATSGSGTLTIARSGSGNLIWNNNNITLPLEVTGLLTLSTNYGLSGATLTGNGTIASPGYASVISNDAPAFTGSITGNFSFSGTNKTFNGNVFNNCDFAAGSEWTFTGASSGAINAIGANCTAKVRGSFGATSGTTFLVNGGGLLAFYGSGSFNAGRIIEVSNNTGTITLQESSTGLSSEVRETGASGVLTFGVEDDTTCTYSGNMTVNSATGATTKIRSKGTLTMSGTVSGGAAGRTISLNSDSGYTGTIRVTGAGFATSSPVTLSQGKLHLNRAGTINIGGSTGLTVVSGATVGCSSTGAYAAQLSGAMVLQANSTLKFGAAP